jgi:hypothetical protein
MKTVRFMIQCALMTTHRSLNKLEFKAHMSIHNFTDVPEQESAGSNGTRDRFGKTHRLSEEDGTLRIRAKSRKKAPAALLLAVCLWGGAAWAANANQSCNVQIESSMDDSWLNERREKHEKFGIPLNESDKVGFNEDGDPSWFRDF